MAAATALCWADLMDKSMAVGWAETWEMWRDVMTAGTMVATKVASRERSRVEQWVRWWAGQRGDMTVGWLEMTRAAQKDNRRAADSAAAMDVTKAVEKALTPAGSWVDWTAQWMVCRWVARKVSSRAGDWAPSWAGSSGGHWVAKRAEQMAGRRGCLRVAHLVARTAEHLGGWTVVKSVYLWVAEWAVRTARPRAELWEPSMVGPRARTLVDWTGN